MIDLRNTWCYANAETKSFLIDFNEASINFTYKYIVFIDGRIGGSLINTDLKPTGKQVHLVNGKFEYVQESLTDEQKEELEQLGINKNSEGVPNDVTSDDLVGLQTRKKADCFKEEVLKLVIGD